MDENKYPYIYLDLDETLIYTECFTTEPKRPPEGAFVFKMGSYWYQTLLRDCAKDLIKFCRGISVCRILTAATRPYAKLISDHFDLGFEHEEIVDRYQYSEWIEDGWCGYGGYSRGTMVSKPSVGHINSILVDNQEPDLPNARIKREWLGISPDRYVEFPEWNGGNEGRIFADKYENIKSTIAVLVAEIIRA